MSDLFSLNDFEDNNSEKDKLVFAENIPVKMKILETKDGVLEKSGYPYYVIACRVLNGDHAGKDYDLFVNTKYKNKDGEEKVPYGFKKVLQGLTKSFAITETKEGRGNDLPETFKTQIAELIGQEIEIAFFKKEGDYQNLIYVKSLSAAPVAAKEESKETPAGKDNSF